MYSFGIVWNVLDCLGDSMNALKRSKINTEQEEEAESQKTSRFQGNYSEVIIENGTEVLLINDGRRYYSFMMLEM